MILSTMLSDPAKRGMWLDVARCAIDRWGQFAGLPDETSQERAKGERETVVASLGLANPAPPKVPLRFPVLD